MVGRVPEAVVHETSPSVIAPQVGANVTLVGALEGALEGMEVTSVGAKVGLEVGWVSN